MKYMTVFPNLAELREALRSDGERKDRAYESVYDAGLRPDDVLGSEPPEDELVEAGVIPADESGDAPAAVEQRQRIIELLEELKEGS